MSYALGQPVPLRALVYDSSGALDDATTASLTITLPDGTTATPTVTNPPLVTGTYTYDYTPTVQGLHFYRFVFGGTNACAPPVDSFYVDGTSLPPMVSLAEARQQCRIGTTTDDALLQRYLLVASSLCERHTQIWRRQTITSTHDGGRQWLRLKAPAISVTTVTEDDVAVTSTGYVLDGTRGWLYRGTETSADTWSIGTQNIDVTYVAGVSTGVIPDEVRQGVLLLTEHLWNTQRGGSRLPRSDGPDWALPVGFSIPNAVREQWAPWAQVLVG